MENPFAKLSRKYKGILLIIVGFFLLLYTLGIIEKGLNLLLIIGAVFMIGYGIFLSNIHHTIQNLISKR